MKTLLIYFLNVIQQKMLPEKKINFIIKSEIVIIQIRVLECEKQVTTKDSFNTI